MLNKIKGALFGAAIGDSLGAPVEFLTLTRIIKKYGVQGIADFQPFGPDYDLEKFPAGSYTDDTQMLLATVQGLIDIKEEGLTENIHMKFYENYLQWYNLQDMPIHDRKPGQTCLDALGSLTFGTVQQPINDSKGSGGLMRVSPIGLCFEPKEAFKVAMDSAAITHGHPTGYLTAGVLAAFISGIARKETFEDSLVNAVEELKKHAYHEETLKYILHAIQLLEEGIKPAYAITLLSKEEKGWSAEEVLAISLVLSFSFREDFEKGMLAAVNQNGDSDTVASIVGSILGTQLTLDKVPQKWVSTIENGDIINDLSEEIHKLYFK